MLGVGLALPNTTLLGLLVLPRAQLAAGSAIAALAALHTVIAQGAPGRGRRLVPRELVVGGLLALACGVFALPDGGPACVCVALAALFTLDCWIVADFEVASDRRRGEASLARRWAWASRALPGLGALAGLAAGFAWATDSGPTRPLWLGLAVGAAGLALLTRTRPRPAELRPALADLALCFGALCALLA